MDDRAIKLSEISDEKFHLGSTNILNGLKEDFKLISGKNIFPGSIFPPIMQELIRELESTLNFSPDYTSASILYAVSVSIGNRIQLKVKNSWLEKSNLYMVYRKKNMNTCQLKRNLKLQFRFFDNYC